MDTASADRRTGRAVALTVLAGAGGIAAVTQLPLMHRTSVRDTLGWMLVLLALSCVGELAYVRVRHGETAEDLTFYEAVVVTGVLFLSPVAALLVPLAALAVANAVMRRPVLKALFNIGSYAASTSAMVIVYTWLGTGVSRFSLVSVAAVLLGALTFAAVNLLALAAVLAAAQGGRLTAVLRAEWRLSAFMAVGNVALGVVGLALAINAPVLVPFAAMPALALGYAYRSAARGAEERTRGTHLVALGAALARNPVPAQLLDDVAGCVHRAFDAAAVRVAVPERGWLVEVSGRGWDAERRPEVGSADAGLGVGIVRLEVLLNPSAGSGAGSRPWGRERRFGDGERALLTSIAGTVASALASAVHSAALREETAKLSSVVEHASDGIVVLDGAGAPILWSPAMERVTGRTAAAVFGTAFPGPHPLARLGAALGAASSEQLRVPLDRDHPRADVQLGLTRPDGQVRQVRVSVSALFDPDGSPQQLVAIVHDITREERLARLKNDFVATVSHELRTPITPIKGYARLLATHGDAMKPEQRERAVTVIEERADHLSRLVDDLLLASKVSGGGVRQLQMELRQQNVSAVVAQTLENLPEVAARTSLHAPETPVWATCDSTRVVQCLTNLLTNATKYSPAGSPVTMRVGQAEDGGAEVSVVDRGRGIPADELELIFEQFHRVEDAMTMTTDGSGLGLFITRELARAMGGEVTVTSELGAGSCFTLRLPGVLSEASAA